MQKELDFHVNKTKKTVYDLLCDEYVETQVDEAFAKVHHDLESQSLWRWTEEVDYDPDDVCVVCKDVLYDTRYEDWEAHIILENPQHTFQFCPQCKHTIIEMFKEHGICIPKALLKVE